MVQKPFITEAMHLEHVQRHRQVRRVIEDLCFLWGYQPVETPLLDEYDRYRDHISTQLEHDSYRLIDRTGKIMLLRSDITLFLARQLGRHLTVDELPLRISYAGSIVRYESDDEIRSGDNFQAGAELIGVSGNDGDAEILLLAACLFRTLGIPQTALHIGSRRLLQLIWPHASSTQLEEIADAVRYRQQDTIGRFCDAGAAIPAARVNQVFAYIAEARQASAEAAAGLNASQEILDEISRIIQLAQLVQELEPGIQVRVDFSEVGARDYYSGMAFQMYCPGAARAVAGGGRYDTLLGDFGCSAPSVGFSIVQSVIEPLVKIFTDPQLPKAVGIPADREFRTRFKQAQSLRAEGKATHL
ncbi:MAG: ATP phosphoribosyltransferase regulatory subunit [Spirochaeta sp.]